MFARKIIQKVTCILLHIPKNLRGYVPVTLVMEENSQEIGRVRDKSEREGDVSAI